MTRDKARALLRALRRLTVANGATPDEAYTAAKKAEAIAGKFSFVELDEARPPRASWRWEWRRCGKRGCHCRWGALHGPYKYSKRRRGKTVVSVYRGK